MFTDRFIMDSDDVVREMNMFFDEILSDTKRLEIARMIANGKRRDDIAKQLHMSIENVKKHIKIMKQESGSTSLHGLAVYLGFALVMKSKLSADRKSIFTN